jgi:O-antigen/teichoic acid export membrane protein
LHYSVTIVLCAVAAAVGLLLTVVSTTAGDALQALQRLHVVAIVNLVAGLLLTITSVVVVWFGAGPVGVAVSYLVGPLVSAPAMLWIIRRHHFAHGVRWSTKRAAALLWEARHITTQALLGSVSNNAEALMVPRIVGATLFGYFSAGALLANRLTTFPDGICTAAFPAMVDATRQGARQTLRVFVKFLLLMLAGGIPASLAVWLAAGPISSLLFPHHADVCKQVIRITVWMLPLMGVEGLVVALLLAFHKDAEQTRAKSLGAIVTVILAAAAVWKFGIVGACWSMVLRYAVYLALIVPCLVRTVRDQLAEEREAVEPTSATPLGVV